VKLNIGMSAKRLKVIMRIKNYRNEIRVPKKRRDVSKWFQERVRYGTRKGGEPRAKESVGSNGPHPTNKAIQRLPDRGEPKHTTAFTLDMLAQPTESTEPFAAGAKRANIRPIQMSRTSEVLIKCGQRMELVVAQITLVGAPIPRSACSGVGDFAATRSSEKARRVRDDIVRVAFSNDPVDDRAVDTRATGPSFEVEDKSRLGNEGGVAVMARADDVAGAMNGGVHVAAQVGLALEQPSAWDAVGG
jgi:hypothetical protein